MIIGRGLLASLFIESDREDVIFFASGVSNSLEDNPQEFLREENLIKKTMEENPDKLFIYFSTCSIYDSSKTGSDYVLHKLKMEQLIKNSCGKYLILRVSNAVGNGGNPNLLMNYLIRSIKNNETINVHTKATRNLIDAEDIKNITFQLIEKSELNKIVNVAYVQNYTIIEILEIIERFYNTNIYLNLIKSGSGYDINIPDVEDYFRINNLNNKESYLCRILEKYYS
ncbi:NAD-dependent epimerase/dehydratase family protein [Epilithonimonas hominis]|uniref:NAD-dependent epimerase/dehydratase family protein n=1 Tax=Epilithonimonas hominis TaxID=420404 RepID=A0A3N0X4S9_9FLAO|nr:NAD-dependent epimerase/dehydratase family protein [Epilithonimonas hominis]ROI12404.1 NAD-dependent epimerase/dehydratase family protein [Epilithonimonas hominis]